MRAALEKMTSHAPQIFLISTTRTHNLRSPSYSSPLFPFVLPLRNVFYAPARSYTHITYLHSGLSRKSCSTGAFFFFSLLSVSLSARSLERSPFPAWFKLVLESRLLARNTYARHILHNRLGADSIFFDFRFRAPNSNVFARLSCVINYSRYVLLYILLVSNIKRVSQNWDTSITTVPLVNLRFFSLTFSFSLHLCKNRKKKSHTQFILSVNILHIFVKNKNLKRFVRYFKQREAYEIIFTVGPHFQQGLRAPFLSRNTQWVSYPT